MPRAYAKAALVAVSLACGAATASAQFGGIFGDPPPRPPSSVPGGRQQFPSPQPSYQAPPPNYAQPPATPPPSGAIQSRPLAPPPGGSAAIEPGAAVGPQTLPGWPPARRQPRPAQPPEPLPDEAYAEPKTPKVPNTSALFSGLDKITGRIIN